MRIDTIIGKCPRFIGVPLLHLVLRYRVFKNRKLIDDLAERMRTEFAAMNIERPPADE